MPHNISFEKLASYDPGDEGITIGVGIRLDTLSARFNAKIDTGASLCIFEKQIGERLGIDIESGVRRGISTATGSFDVFGHDVTLITEGYEFDSLVHFAADESFNRSVLGRYGWLNRVRIAIVDYDGEFYLSRYKDE